MMNVSVKVSSRLVMLSRILEMTSINKALGEFLRGMGNAKILALILNRFLIATVTCM